MSDGFNFAPPSMPSGPSGAPNQISQSPNFEGGNEFARSVARSAKIRSSTQAIIKTRADFKKFLNGNDMDLFTSAVEFQQSGDFVLSSYVVYKNHSDYTEPLTAFLDRYPQFKEPVMVIRDQLRPVQNNMQVLTPKLSKPNPFENTGR